MSEAWNDDDVLMARIDEARRSAGEVPERFLRTGRAAFAPRNLDAELAELSYDSALTREPAMRAGSTSLRAMTFTSASLTIDLEFSHDAAHGQLVPGRTGEVRVTTLTGPSAVVTPIDSVSGFEIRPLPDGPFTLFIHGAGDAADVTTTWIDL